MRLNSISELIELYCYRVELLLMMDFEEGLT